MIISDDEHDGKSPFCKLTCTLAKLHTGTHIETFRGADFLVLLYAGDNGKLTMDNEKPTFDNGRSHTYQPTSKLLELLWATEIISVAS